MCDRFLSQYFSHLRLSTNLRKCADVTCRAETQPCTSTATWLRPCNGRHHANNLNACGCWKRKSPVVYWHVCSLTVADGCSRNFYSADMVSVGLRWIWFYFDTTVTWVARWGIGDLIVGILIGGIIIRDMCAVASALAVS